MNAAEVIAQEVWQAYVVELGRSMPEGLADKLAAGVVPALKAARYAVVELPRQTIVPTGWRHDCVGCWPSGFGEHDFEDPVSAWPGDEGISLPNGDFMSAARARVFAAALLAAADAAECAS